MKTIKHHKWLEVEVVSTPEEIERFDKLLDEEHYLQAGSRIGDYLRQVIIEEGQWVGLLAWGPACYSLKDRDQWIGWDGGRRVQRLKLIVQNRRFLVPEKKRRPNLASQCLGAAVRVLPQQWKEAFGYEPVLAETFTDIELFEGTCYKAAGWEPLGVCEGHSRHRADYYVPNGRPKKLWVKKLTERACEVLQGKLQQEHQKALVGGATGEVGWKETQIYSLKEWLREVPDPRHKHAHFKIGPVLAIVAMAILGGAEQVSEVARYAWRLNQKQRAQLGLRVSRGKKTRPVPSYSVFYEVLRRVDSEAFSAKLNEWLIEHEGSLPKVWGLDGKTVRDRVMLVSLSTEEGAPARVAVCKNKGHELSTGQTLIEEAPHLDNVTITADALHCQKNTAQAIVDKGGEYILQIKSNQPNLLKLAKTHLAEASPLLSKTKKATGVRKHGNSAESPLTL